MPRQLDVRHRSLTIPSRQHVVRYVPEVCPGSTAVV